MQSQKQPLPPIKQPKKSQKQQLCQSITLTIHKLPQNQIIYFLLGYISSSINIIPNQQNISQLKQILVQLQNSYKQQIISSTNFVQILTQVMSYWKFVKSSDKDNSNIDIKTILNKFQQKVYQLCGQLACNRKYLRQKWMKQIKTQSQILSFIQMQQQKIKNNSKIQQQSQQQTLRLIKQLQQQDKKQLQRKRLEKQKQSEQYIQEIIKQQQEQKKQRLQSIMKMEEQNMTCQICLEIIRYTDVGTLSCGHIFHKQCIHGHIQALVNQKKVDIPCPAACGKNMLLTDIQQFIDGELKQKFQKFCFDLYVQKNDKQVSWCPSPGCTAVFTVQGGLDNYRCPVCHKHYCLGCRCQYHHGMSCAQYRISHSYGEDDRKFQEFVRGAKFKQCPKCKYWVERTQGCSTMSCRCGHQFCYDCGGSDCPHGMCKNGGGGGGIIGGLIPIIRPGRRR